MNRDPWEQMMEDAQNATYVECRVLKRTGFFDPHQVGDIIGVEDKGVQELVDEGYIEVIEQKEEQGMGHIEEIEKIFKDNTLRIRTRITHNELHLSNFEIQKYHERDMTIKIGEFAKESNRVLFEQSIGEEDKTLQAECVVLHPDTVEKIMSLLGVKYERF